MTSTSSRCSRVELGLGEQPGQAEHAVHRRADLVAHGGEEAALRPVGRLGGELLLFERLAEVLGLAQGLALLGPSKDERLCGVGAAVVDRPEAPGLAPRSVVADEKPAAAVARHRGAAQPERARPLHGQDHALGRQPEVLLELDREGRPEVAADQLIADQPAQRRADGEDGPAGVDQQVRGEEMVELTGGNREILGRWRSSRARVPRSHVLAPLGRR